MATAIDLHAAAAESYQNLEGKWFAGTIKTNLVSFWQASLPSFPEGEVNSHPVSNWLAIIASAAQNMESGNSFLFVPFEEMANVSGYVYRLCSMAAELQTDNVITAGQAATLLAAYNANF